MFCDILKKQIVEFNPTNLNEIFFVYDLNELKEDKDNEIKGLFYNEENKCFNIWIRKGKDFEIKIICLNEQFDKIQIKDNFISKETVIKENTKKLKMEKFAQNIFKTTISFSSSKKNMKKHQIP